MRNGQNKICPKSKVCTKAFREIFRGVVWVVDVPLKLISDRDSTDAHVNLDDSDLLEGQRNQLLVDREPLRHWQALLTEMADRHLSRHYLVPSKIFDLLFKLVYNLGLVGLIEVVLLEQDFRKTLQSEVWLVLVPKEDFPEALAFNLEVDFDWYQATELVLG